MLCSNLRPKSVLQLPFERQDRFVLQCKKSWFMSRLLIGLLSFSLTRLKALRLVILMIPTQV
ncbi:hypothetical protein BC443_17970 [Salinicola sp. MIT1003]|nr:hypothetical protein BC443_17970 [Salinicola sp. MIT1003]